MPSVLAERLGASRDAAFADAVHAAPAATRCCSASCSRALAAEGYGPTRARRLSAEIGPRAVSRTILLRLARLERTPLAVAHAVAILGESADLRHVAALAGLDEARWPAPPRPSPRADILRADAPLGFVHPLVRDAVYNDLAPAERELRTRVRPELLREARGAGEQVAAQVLQAPRRGDRETVETLIAAARQAWVTARSTARSLTWSARSTSHRRRPAAGCAAGARGTRGATNGAAALAHIGGVPAAHRPAPACGVGL